MGELRVTETSTVQMPALLAVSRLRQEMEAGNGLPLALLGQAVLHDERLTASILQVVNHLAYNHGAGHITTLGRAIGLLGFSPVKSICITARFVGALLHNRTYSADEQLRLRAKLAHAFHAAMQARYFMQECDVEAREQAFVAALLHQLGEPADCRVSPHCQQAIALADNFCKAVLHGWRDEETLRNIENIAAFLGVSVSVAERRLRLCTHQTCELVELYGAEALLAHLPAGYGHHHTQTTAPPSFPSGETHALLQLQLLYELAVLVLEKPDFDLVLHTALEGIQRGLGMDRCLACLLDSEGEQMTPRFALGRDSDIWSRHFTMNLGSTDNVFNDVVQHGACRWLGSPQMPFTHPLCKQRVLHMTCGSECFIAPLQFGDRVIGILYADRYVNRHVFTEADFLTFKHFALQVRMCLQMAMQMC